MWATFWLNARPNVPPQARKSIALSAWGHVTLERGPPGADSTARVRHYVALENVLHGRRAGATVYRRLVGARAPWSNGSRAAETASGPRRAIWAADTAAATMGP